MKTIPALLLGGLLMPAALPAPAYAAPRPVITMELAGEDGVRLPPIDLTDFQVSLGRSNIDKSAAEKAAAGSTDDVTDQFSAMLDLAALSNPGLIGWIGKGGGNSTVQVKVVGTGQTTTYTMNGLSSVSLSISHSTSGMEGQASLSIGSRHLAINGTAVN